jgi:hypothetical protein
MKSYCRERFATGSLLSKKDGRERGIWGDELNTEHRKGEEAEYSIHKRGGARR